MRHFSRRDFLKTTVAGTVGLALVGSRAKAQSPEEKGFVLSMQN